MRYSDIRLEVWLKHRTLPIVWDDVVQTTVEDGLFCVCRSNPSRLEKFPLCNIDRIMQQMPTDADWVGQGDE
jgi:hypothetical protein